MGRFNKSATGSTLTVNHEGAVAHKLSAELELYSAVCTSALSNKFYESSDERIERIRGLLKKVDPTFAAKLAVYAREQMYLRSIPLVLAVELAKVHNGDNLVGRLVGRVIQRADEITELLGYYAQANGRTGTKKLGKLPNQFYNGLAFAFNKFDEYQFAKYNRDGEVKLRDALFLVHPKPMGATKKDKTAKEKLFEKIADETLETPYTWETELSELGQKKFKDDEAKEKAFRAKWEELLEAKEDGKYLLGYMALLRNLRNILQSKVRPKFLSIACNRLADAEEVARSRQFPFRFMSAYKELKEAEDLHFDVDVVLEALEEAIKASAVNIKGFDVKTRICIACDVSGSMQSTISEKSKVQNYDIGLVLGMVLNSRCKSTMVGMFGDTWKTIAVPKKDILRNAEEFHNREGEVGYSTNGYMVLRDLNKKQETVDKIMMFTDCQLWDSYGEGATLKDEWRKYKKNVNPNAKLYLFDLSGYGNTPLQVNDNDVFMISGWSDKVFDVMDAMEKGDNAIDVISKIII